MNIVNRKCFEMARVNSQGYIERLRVKGCWRNWWLVKHRTPNQGELKLRIILPKKYLGKKIRLKVELIEND